jgi:hypothetical protein
MGLVILLVVLAYLAVLIGTPIIGYRLAAKRGWEKSRRRLVAVLAFLAIFLPMFWDWLPTVWLHSYYCDKYSGITVNKTPAQWKQANPGVAETITRPKQPAQTGYWPRYSIKLSERFRLDIESREKALSLREYEERIVDDRTEEVLVRLVDFSTGEGLRRLAHFRDIKVWMHRGSCEAEDDPKLRKQVSALSEAFAGLGDTK